MWLEYQIFYVGAVYLPIDYKNPGGGCADGILAELLADVLRFGALGDVVLGGDFNAHMGELSGDRRSDGSFRTWVMGEFLFGCSFKRP